MTPPAGPGTPRLLHPAAWWIWALCLAVAASRTTNPVLLLLIVAVTGWVCLERREPGQSAVLVAFLLVGAGAVVLRMVSVVLFGGAGGGQTVLLRLPEVTLPNWAAGVRLGGEVTAEELLTTGYQALQPAAVLVCLGAANALASPRRLLRYLPATLYDIGTALVVGLSLAPQLVDDSRTVYRARRLRGHSGRGPREVARMVVPVTAGALDRALELAASMESRGYGRTSRPDPAARHRATAVTILGLVGVLIGLYALLDGSTPPVLGLPMLLGGLVVALAALLTGASRDRRTHYRRQRWQTPETLVVVVGLVAAGVLSAGSLQSWDGMVAAGQPTQWPGLPLLAVAAVLAPALAAVVSPAPVGRPA